jgi:hypothetical protein
VENRSAARREPGAEIDVSGAGRKRSADLRSALIRLVPRSTVMGTGACKRQQKHGRKAAHVCLSTCLFLVCSDDRKAH